MLNPSQSFWDAWRVHKETLKQAGFTVTRYNEKWQVTEWSNTDPDTLEVPAVNRETSTVAGKNFLNPGREDIRESRDASIHDHHQQHHVSATYAMPGISTINDRQAKKGNRMPRGEIRSLIVGIACIALVGVAILSIAGPAKPSQNTPEDPETPPYNPPDDPDPPATVGWEVDSSGTASYIVDGDTFDIGSLRIRLADVNTPEEGESGYSTAKDYLASLIRDKFVYLDVDDVYETDVYGRTVAVVYVRHNSTHLKNVNECLLDASVAEIANYYNEFSPYSWNTYVYYPVL